MVAATLRRSPSQSTNCLFVALRWAHFQRNPLVRRSGSAEKHEGKAIFHSMCLARCFCGSLAECRSLVARKVEAQSSADLDVAGAVNAPQRQHALSLRIAASARPAPNWIGAGRSQSCYVNRFMTTIKHLRERLTIARSKMSSPRVLLHRRTIARSCKAHEMCSAIDEGQPKEAGGRPRRARARPFAPFGRLVGGAKRGGNGPLEREYVLAGGQHELSSERGRHTSHCWRLMWTPHAMIVALARLARAKRLRW